MDRTPKKGERLRVVEKLQSTAGLMVTHTALSNRHPSAEGVECGYVGGHGGDVWWVLHDDGTVAPYLLTELQPAGAR